MAVVESLYVFLRTNQREIRPGRLDNVGLKSPTLLRQSERPMRISCESVTFAQDPKYLACLDWFCTAKAQQLLDPLLCVTFFHVTSYC